MININNFEITYMGKKCTIGDYVKYRKDISKCKDVEKIGALVYLHKAIDNISLTGLYFDSICEQWTMDNSNAIAIKVIAEKKIKKVPLYLKDLFDCENEDEKYDLFVKFLSDCGVS